MVHSFDIFDTVVTRRLASPHDVFALLAERLRAEGIRTPSPLRFAWLRIRAERWAARFVAKRSVKLEHIYRILGILLGWSRHICQQAMILERELEASLLVATPYGLEAVQASRNLGHTVAFISDMYLDSRFLDRLLQREGLKQEGEILMVSCEHGSSKAAGDIWPMFLDKAGITADKCFHRGDNLHGDLASPQKHGIAAKRLGTAEVSRWEQWCPRSSGLALEKWGEIAAMSRLARVCAQDPDHYWTQLGTGVLGPMIAGFVSWLLDTAVKDGIDTLWFLSRDGWLFYKAAQHLVKDREIKIRYLAVSRNQLRFARDPGCPISELWRGSRHLSARLVRDRLNFFDADMAELLRECGLPTWADDVSLTPPAREALCKILETPTWKERRAERARQASAVLKSYLDECAAASSGDVAVVDIGWKGRSQDDLMRLCPSVKNGYYLGLSHGTWDSHKIAWLYDARRDEGDIRIDRYQRMIEMLVGGVSGPLQGYEQYEEGWRPLFAEREEGEAAPGRELMQNVAMAFVTNKSFPFSSDESMLSYVTVNMIRLFAFPTKQDARYFSSWKCSTDDAHQDFVHPARGYDLRRILSCIRAHEPWALLWLEASILNSPFLGGLFIKWSWRVKNWF